MKNFVATYYNATSNKTNTMIVMAQSLSEAIKAEEASMAMFQRISPHLSLISVKES